jgi:hypothetical protein
MVMQQVMRPYASAGIALVGASIIAVTPIAAPLPQIQMRPVQLVDAWSDLVTNTTANLDSIFSNASSSDISQLFSELVTNPYGVIEAFANFDPTVTTDLTSLPATISVELPPGLELAIAGLGATGATFSALESVAQQLQTDPSFSNLYEGVATVLNAYLNGADNVSLLDGAITIPLLNGLLAPEVSGHIDINLTSLVDALGLGNTSLTDLNLSGLLDQLGLGSLDLGGLFSALGLSDDGLGTLLGDPTLGKLLTDLGLGNLGLGNLDLTNVLSTLGLNVNLDSLSLNTVLGVFGIDPTINLGLGTALSDLGFGGLVNTGLGTELSNLGLLTPLVTELNSALGTLLGPEAAALDAVLVSIAPGLNIGTLLDPTSLENALNVDTVGSLLGGQSIDATVSTLLSDLGVSVPGNLTIGGILEGLGAPSTIGDLTLGGLLGGLNLDGLDVTGLLNSVTLGDLLGDLGLSDLPLNLSNLGDLSGLTLDGLLGDLGLGDLANVTVGPLGGFDTLLVDFVPQQILAALGM